MIVDASTAADNAFMAAMALDLGMAPAAFCGLRKMAPGRAALLLPAASPHPKIKRRLTIRMDPGRVSRAPSTISATSDRPRGGSALVHAELRIVIGGRRQRADHPHAPAPRPTTREQT